MRTGPVRDRDLVAVGLAGGDSALRLQLRHDPLARVQRREAGELGARRVVHAPVLADDGDLLETVGAPDLEVVGVVARRDLQGARAELRPDVLVRDDRDAALDQRDRRRGADQRSVPLVVRVHGHRRVGQDRLRAHRGHHHVSPALHVVAHVVEDVVDLLLDDLEVGDRRAAPRVPVDQVAVTVDHALLVQRHEHAQDGGGVRLVQGEALVAEVR